MSGLAGNLLANALMATVLAGVLALVGGRIRRPAVLHFLWLTVLLRLLAPPAWTVGELPGLGWVSLAGGQQGLDQVRSSIPVGEPEMSAPEPSRAEDHTPASLPAAGQDPAMAPDPAAVVAGGTAASGVEPRPPADAVEARLAPAESSSLAGPSSSTPPVVPWTDALFGLWLVGSLWALASLVLRSRRFARAVRHAEPADGPGQAVASALAARLGLRRAPRLLLVDAHLPPLVWSGWQGTRVLFPKAMFESLPTDQRDALLAHELAHVARRDPWVRWVEAAATVMFWWLPTLWWARARLRLSEEMACDAWVTWCLPGHGRAYALALVHTLDSLSARSWSAPPLTSGVRPLDALRRRLTMILSTSSSRSPRLPWRGGAFVATLLVLGTSVGVAGGVQDGDPVARPAPPLHGDRAQEEAKIRRALEGFGVTQLKWAEGGLEVRVSMALVSEAGMGLEALQERAALRGLERLGWSPLKLQVDREEMHLILLSMGQDVQGPSRFRAGDRLVIRDGLHPDDLDGDFRVAEDGTITHPVIGRVEVAGHSLSDLAESLRESFAAYFSELDLRFERVPAPTADDVTLIRLRYAIAEETAETLRSLLAASRDSQPVPDFEVHVDPRTNSLLVTGDAAIRNEVNALARRLDIEVVEPEGAGEASPASPAPATTIDGRIQQLETEQALLRARMRALEVELESLRAARAERGKKASDLER